MEWENKATERFQNLIQGLELSSESLCSHTPHTQNARLVRAFLIQKTQINIQTSFKNGRKTFYRQNTIVMI